MILQKTAQSYCRLYKTYSSGFPHQTLPGVFHRIDGLWDKSAAMDVVEMFLLFYEELEDQLEEQYMLRDVGER